jgi:thiamine transporter
MQRNRTRALVEIALAVALAAVLNLLAMRLPINLAGGSVSLTMLPIAVIALRRGSAVGMIAGALFGSIDLLMEPFVIFPEQALFDYPLPYLLFGLGVGLFSRLYKKVENRDSANNSGGSLAKGSGVVMVALLVGGILRYASHVLSGVIFFSRFVVDDDYEVVQSWTAAFAHSAGDGATWVFSLIYNISYLAPSLVASLVLALIIVPILARLVPVNHEALTE